MACYWFTQEEKNELIFHMVRTRKKSCLQWCTWKWKSTLLKEWVHCKSEDLPQKKGHGWFHISTHIICFLCSEFKVCFPEIRLNIARKTCSNSGHDTFSIKIWVREDYQLRIWAANVPVYLSLWLLSVCLSIWQVFYCNRRLHHFGHRSKT